MIAEILDEIADYDLPDEDMEILKKVKEHLDKKEFNEIRNLIDN